MMLQAASAVPGLAPPRVLTASANDPAARLGGPVQLGDLADPQTLRTFFGACDIITFESEFHLAETLATAAESLPVHFVPSLDALRTTQDKLQQKALCESLGVPTAPYRELPKGLSNEELDIWLGRCAAELEAPTGALVLKWARFGYDGKGTFFWSPERPSSEVRPFLEAADARHSAVFAERRISFQRELAQVAVHGVNGSFACYPTVISEQPKGICKRVIGPARCFGVATALEAQAARFAERIARALPLHGTFALELFEEGSGALWLNEMAPRVHNSGHFSLDAECTSQFENHLRAISGAGLGPTASTATFAMLNLIGNCERKDPPPPELPEAQLKLHWYDKNPSRIGRKLGHLNATAASAAALLPLLDALDACDQAWLAQLQSLEE